MRSGRSHAGLRAPGRQPRTPRNGIGFGLNTSVVRQVVLPAAGPVLFTPLHTETRRTQVWLTRFDYGA